MKNSEIVEKIEQIFIEENCNYKDALKILKYLKDKIEISSRKVADETSIEEIILKANLKVDSIPALDTYFLDNL